MTYSQRLEIIAHWSAVLTSVVALSAYGLYLYERRQKRVRLEKYLKLEKETGAGEGLRTLVHLSARLGMTETELVDAAFRSKHIIRKVSVDKAGHASKMLLGYSENSKDTTRQT